MLASWQSLFMPAKRCQKGSESIETIAPLLVGVQTHPERDVSLESLAREWGYSPSHFHRLFTETVGETPKEHVERVRLERAALRVAVGSDPFLEIALAVGFRSHETFTRAFQRHFGMTPTTYRRVARIAQKERMERMKTFRGDGCTLSETTFLTLRPMTLLAVRRIGPYDDCSNLPPFSAGDTFWSRIAAFAERRGIAYRRLPIAISYDNPGMTPPHLQHLDACLPLVREASGENDIKRLDFAGGPYGAIEHRGPYETHRPGLSHRSGRDSPLRPFHVSRGSARADLPRVEHARRSGRQPHRSLLPRGENLMRAVSFAIFVAWLASPSFAQQNTGSPMSSSAPIVFFDIAGKPQNTLREFYSQIFGWEIAPDGRFTAQVKSPPLVPRSDYTAAAGFTTMVTAPLPGQIRQDPSEKRVYLGVADVATTLDAIRAKGGTIDAPRFEVPGVVVLGLFKDPEGNAMGLIEMDGDRVKIP